MKWIKCEEKLPEKNGSYLVVEQYYDHRTVKILKFALDLNKVNDWNFTEHAPGWYEFDPEKGFSRYKGITHWSELPPLPEEHRKEYVDAVIRLKVPEWQIGQEVNVHFPDTMCKKGVCEYE